MMVMNEKRKERREEKTKRSRVKVKQRGSAAGMRAGILARGKEATGSVNRKNGSVAVGGGGSSLCESWPDRNRETSMGSVMVMRRGREKGTRNDEKNEG
jgi:hypothetical protein